MVVSDSLDIFACFLAGSVFKNEPFFHNRHLTMIIGCQVSLGTLGIFENSVFTTSSTQFSSTRYQWVNVSNKTGLSWLHGASLGIDVAMQRSALPLSAKISLETALPETLGDDFFMDEGPFKHCSRHFWRRVVHEFFDTKQSTFYRLRPEIIKFFSGAQAACCWRLACTRPFSCVNYGIDQT